MIKKIIFSALFVFMIYSVAFPNALFVPPVDSTQSKDWLWERFEYPIVWIPQVDILVIIWLAEPPEKGNLGWGEVGHSEPPIYPWPN